MGFQLSKGTKFWGFRDIFSKFLTNSELARNFWLKAKNLGLTGSYEWEAGLGWQSDIVRLFRWRILLDIAQTRTKLQKKNIYQPLALI